MAIQKASAIEKRDASSVQEIIRLLTLHEKLNLRTSNACCVKEITQPIIKTARFTKIYKTHFPTLRKKEITNKPQPQIEPIRIQSKTVQAESMLQSRGKN